MKILVVGTGGSIVSGISTAADEMARALPGWGYEAERLHTGERMRRRSGTLNLENVTAAAGDARAVYRRARRWGADVVWIHTFGFPTLAALRALAIVGAARLAGCRAVVHFHAFGLEEFVAGAGWPLRVAVRASGRLSNAMVVVHRSAAEALATVSGAAVRVVENWVEVPDDVAPFPAQPPLRLVFVGGLVARKGVPELLQAMRALGDVPVELRLVGGAGEDGPDALQRLRGASQDLVAEGRVTFAGEQPPDGVRAELAAAHLFVLPSKAEGTPMSMLEALAQGRPVLVSAAGDMGVVVRESGCGWVLPDLRPETLAARIRDIADDPKALAAAAAAARRTAVARYSSDARRADVADLLAAPLRPRRPTRTASFRRRPGR